MMIQADDTKLIKKVKQIQVTAKNLDEQQDSKLNSM